jgi:hypothetical protein
MLVLAYGGNTPMTIAMGAVALSAQLLIQDRDHWR